MKKQLGIIRNRHERLATFKKEAHRKKNRFQMVGKDDLDDMNAFTLTTANSDPASFAELSDEADEGSLKAVKLFQQARGKMKKVAELQKKMEELTKARLVSLRDKQNQKYDEKISKLASEATQALMVADGVMKQISKLEVASATSKKILKSMASSLAGEIQATSRKLRTQEQEYFRRIKTYEGTFNSAMTLTAEQRKTMEGEEGEWDLMEEKEEDLHQGKVSELVGSISKLSNLYKQLGNLVVEQGTVIDRIDYNLEQTEEHTGKAVVHLTGADSHASSPFADKVIKTLAISIVLLAIILGLKYMS